MLFTGVSMMMICNSTVATSTPMKMGDVKMPDTMLYSSRILRELSSLNTCMKMKALKSSDLASSSSCSSSSSKKPRARSNSLWICTHRPESFCGFLACGQIPSLPQASALGGSGIDNYEVLERDKIAVVQLRPACARPRSPVLVKPSAILGDGSASGYTGLPPAHKRRGNARCPRRRAASGRHSRRRRGQRP